MTNKLLLRLTRAALFDADAIVDADNWVTITPKYDSVAMDYGHVHGNGIKERAIETIIYSFDGQNVVKSHQAHT